jgi:hypothetical protein
MIAETRTWLTEDELIFDRMVSFHRQRVEAIQAGTSHIPVKTKGKLILHLFPEQSMRSRRRFTPTELKQHSQQIPLIGDRSGGMTRINVDGFVRFDRWNDVKAYCQLFNNGRLEAVMSDTTAEARGEGDRILRDPRCEHAVLAVIEPYCQFCKGIGLNPPLWLFVTLTDCKGVRFYDRHGFGGDHAIDREVIELPETQIEALDIQPHVILRPMFDALWNAGGLENSANYDQDGNWRERR